MSDDEPAAADNSTDSLGIYTHEQKIVAAVWVHEKEFNRQTWKDINSNFWMRFNAPPPNRTTFLSWERKLFSVGNVENKEKSGRPLSRLMHVPYVKASLRESPELSLRERSKLLGLPRTTLLKIIRDDLNMRFEVEDDGSNLKRKHAPCGGGKWKLRSGGDDDEDGEKKPMRSRVSSSDDGGEASGVETSRVDNEQECNNVI